MILYLIYFNRYAALPFCMPKDSISYPLSFADKLLGNSKSSSVYQTKFGSNFILNFIRASFSEFKRCHSLSSSFKWETSENIKSSCEAKFCIWDVHWYHYLHLDLFWGFVEDIIVGNSFGYVQDDKTFLNTHLNFFIYYNKQQGVSNSYIWNRWKKKENHWRTC